MDHKNKIQDTTDLLVYGHEGWLEEYPSHYHAGDPVMAKLKWGHNMEIDGLPRLDEIETCAYAPDGSKAPAKLEESGNLWLNLTADTDQEGFYTVMSHYDNSYARFEGDKYKRGTRKEHPDAVEVLNYCQYSSTCISVGHHHETAVPQIQGLEISLLPLTGPKYAVNHEIKFQLTLHDGPAANHPALLIYQSQDGLVETGIQSDDQGQYTICPKEVGTYCIIVRHTNNHNKEGEYDGQSLTATHCFCVAEKPQHHHH